MKTCFVFFFFEFTLITAKIGGGFCENPKLLGGGVSIGVRHHTCTSWRFIKAADGDATFCIGNLVEFPEIWKRVLNVRAKKPGMFEVHVSITWLLKGLL